MKVFTIVFFILSSHLLAAEQHVINCSNPDYKLINEFSLYGSVVFLDEKTWEAIGDLKITLRDQGSESDEHQIYLAPKGNYATFLAGSLAKNEVKMLDYINVELDLDPGQIKRLRLNLDYPGQYTSSLRLNNGHLYRAKCEIK